MSRHGCCVDGVCTPDTCMELPAGITCGDCFHFPRCAALISCAKDNTVCDWFPRRLLTKPQAVDLDQLRGEVKLWRGKRDEEQRARQAETARAEIANKRIQQVLELHGPVPQMRRGHPQKSTVCRECRRSWPCATVRACQEVRAERGEK